MLISLISLQAGGNYWNHQNYRQSDKLRALLGGHAPRYPTQRAQAICGYSYLIKTEISSTRSQVLSAFKNSLKNRSFKIFGQWRLAADWLDFRGESVCERTGLQLTVCRKKNRIVSLRQHEVAQLRLFKGEVQKLCLHGQWPKLFNFFCTKPTKSGFPHFWYEYPLNCADCNFPHFFLHRFLEKRNLIHVDQNMSQS